MVLRALTRQFWLFALACLLPFPLQLLADTTDTEDLAPSFRQNCAEYASVFASVGTLEAVFVAGLYGVYVFKKHERSNDKDKPYPHPETIEGKEHIGFGIYLDQVKIESQLSEAEQSLLENPQENAVNIALMYNRKLHGGFDYARDTPNPPPARNASEFFDQNCESRGVCRHKAVILAALLNRYGIRAIVKAGINDAETLRHAFYQARERGLLSERATLDFSNFVEDGHAWVVLPDLNLLLDPVRTHPQFSYRKDVWWYEARFKDV